MRHCPTQGRVWYRHAATKRSPTLRHVLQRKRRPKCRQRVAFLSPAARGANASTLDSACVLPSLPQCVFSCVHMASKQASRSCWHCSKGDCRRGWLLAHCCRRTTFDLVPSLAHFVAWFALCAAFWRACAVSMTSGMPPLRVLSADSPSLLIRPVEGGLLRRTWCAGPSIPSRSKSELAHMHEHQIAIGCPKGTA